MLLWGGSGLSPPLPRGSRDFDGLPPPPTGEGQGDVRDLPPVSITNNHPDPEFYCLRLERPNTRIPGAGGSPAASRRPQGDTSHRRLSVPFRCVVLQPLISPATPEKRSACMMHQ